MCAERVPARVLLRGEQCPRCQASTRLPGTEDRAAQVLAAISKGWREARMTVYGAVVLATFLSGWVPMLASLVTALAMVTANYLLIRRPLRWLPPVPRALTRLLSRLWFVTLVLLGIALNAVAALFITAGGAGAIASAVIGAGSTYCYVEGSLWLVARGVARAARVRRGEG